jgi:fructose-bisphosphate aldolase class I
MALYALYAQAEGLVPIIEPEVLMDGEHSIADAENVTRRVLSQVFNEMRQNRVELETTILKTSMVLSGSEAKDTAGPDEVADATVRTLLDVVPRELGGVVFLSGGQEPDEAARNLSAIASREPFPWEISFSYARAIQYPALEAWGGRDENIEKAREALLNQLHIDALADQGKLLS